jgi:hypothetical protein
MKRLFKDGLITTILGVLLLGLAAYMYVSKSHTAMEAAELGAMSLIFLRSKDSLIGLTPKKETPQS